MGEHHTIQFSCAYARVLDRKETGDFVVVPVPPTPKQEDPSDLIWLDTPQKRVRL